MSEQPNWPAPTTVGDVGQRPNREPPADPRMRRHCPIRVLLPTQETDSPTPTWTDVGFAYVRELAKTTLAPQIRVMSGDLGGIDLRPASRWLPYRDMFYGLCPQPGNSEGIINPTFVNVVIGAGQLSENLWTLGAKNVLITGYGIPPYKVGWLPNKVWEYDFVVTPSKKHFDILAAEIRHVGQPILTTSVPTMGVPLLAGMLEGLLAQCAPESERVY